MALPCVVFSSSACEFKPEDFVKQILNVSELPEPLLTCDETMSYEWFVDTKYYTTTVHLCTTEKRTIGNKDFADSIQAFVHFFNPNERTSFHQAELWLPFLVHIEPEVQILVCRTSKPTDVVSRRETLEWCIKNGFELVELSPEVDEDEDDDFPETTGMARIIQALHAHTWPNMDMKNSPPVQSPYLREMMREQHLINQQQVQASACFDHSKENLEHLPNAGNSVEANANVPSVEKKSNIEEAHTSPAGSVLNSDCEGKNSFACLEGAQNMFPSNNQERHKCSLSDNPLSSDEIDWKAIVGDSKDEAPLNDKDMGVEEFEQLFKMLKVMKDKGEGLPPEERKKYAEKVTISFWKAIGGDEDELGDLDADSD